MSRTHSRLTRTLSTIASAALVLSGISLIAAVPANAVPTVHTVTGNDIRNSEAVYQGWHEGYNNTQRQFFVDSSGLNLGINSPSQVLNGTAPVQATAAELENIILSSALDLVSGPATFQLPLWFGPGNPQDYTTLRSTSPAAGVNTWTTASYWESSANIPNTGTVVIPKNTPTSLTDILAALSAQGSLRLLGFGVQASSVAVVSSLTYNGVEYQFSPYVAVAPSNPPVIVHDVDLLGPEDDNPASAGYNYTSWHEGKTVDSSTVKSNGLNLGSPGASTTIKGTTVKTAPNDNVKTQSELQTLILNASFTVESGSTTFQVPVNFEPSLANFTTLLSENYGHGTHTFSLTDMWRTSRAFGPYIAFQAVPLGDLLDTLYSVGGGQVWLGGFGAQADSLSVISSLTFDNTEYLFQQPVTQMCTLPLATTPTATNQSSQGWTFGQTRSTGHNDFTADGLHVWTESNTSTDKAAGYKAVNFPLADVGSEPEINMINTSGGLPSIQLGISLNGDGVWNGYLVNEGDIYGHGNWWTNKTGWGVAPGGGYPSMGTINDYLNVHPNATVISIGYSLGSGVLGDATITSIVAGCTSYGFVANDSYATPTTVNVDDSQILPIEDVTGWGDGYGYSPRSYSTAANGAHIGNGHATQLINTFATPMTTTELESLITGASVSVGSGSATYQVAIKYGNGDTFTTLRSNSLTGTDNRFSVTDKWVSTRALVDNTSGTVTTTNYEAPIADLVAFINAQSNVRVLGAGVQSDSPAVVQDIVFNGTKYHFVATAADTAGQTDVRVTQPEIDLNADVYTNWHQDVAGQEATPTFAVGDEGLILEPLNAPVGNQKSQIIKGLDTWVPGADLYSLLTSHAGITVGTGGDVTYQVPVRFDQGRTPVTGWSTLRTQSLSTGAHTFSLSDLWISSKAIGLIPANTPTPLGDILDAMNSYGDAVALGFGVQTESTPKAVVTDITWGNTRYYFDGAITAGTVAIDGTPTYGETLTADPGTWSPSDVNLAYQWKVNGAEIAGATSSTYTPTSDTVGNTIVVTVTGSADHYSDVTATSFGVTIAPATLTTSVPTISGTALVGETLTADAGTWGPGGVDLTYQWYTEDGPIAGATGLTYELTGAENTKTITFKVTGTLAGYTTASKTSADFGPIGLPTIVAVSPEVFGSAVVGETLTLDVHDGSWTPSSGLSFSYVWKADGAPISGATASSFTVTDDEIGTVITVTVTGSKTNYNSGSVTSADMPPVPSPTITSAMPTISGTAKVGETLTATDHEGSWSPSTGLTMAHVWKANGIAIVGATNGTYTLTPGEFGKTITVTVTGSRTNYVSASATSDPTATVTYDPFFADVAQVHPFFLDIQWMWESGTSTGTAQSSPNLPLYKPSDSVSRQAMAAFLYRLSGETFIAPTTPTFADVPATETFYTAIEWMAHKGISTGTAQTPPAKPLFKPVDPVSREAMAAFLYRYEGATAAAPSTSPFADVTTSANFFKEIAWMSSTGLSTGSPNGTDLPLYKPADPVSRQAMAAFLNRMENG